MKLDFFKQKKPILALCLAGAALAAVVGGTLAIYTSQVFQRGVVRNRDSDTIRFSSDILARVSGDPEPQVSYYPVDPEQEKPGIRFTVCNYDQKNSTLFHEEDLHYTITFQLENGSGGPYTIESRYGTESLGNGSLTLSSCCLTGGERSTDTYTFYFPKLDPEASKNLELTVTVRPSDSSLTHGTILTGTLIPIPYGATQGFHARLEFPDSLRGEPDEFAAYNVLVSVTGGKGTVELLWNDELLDIDPFFEKYGEKGTGTMTIPMNSADETAAYLIPFYNKTSSPRTWDGWLKLQGSPGDMIWLGEVTQD